MQWFRNNGIKAGISAACVVVFCAVVFLSIGLLNGKKFRGGTVSNLQKPSVSSEISSESAAVSDDFLENVSTGVGSNQSTSSNSQNNTIPLEIDTGSTGAISEKITVTGGLSADDFVVQYGDWIYYDVKKLGGANTKIVKSKPDGSSRQVLYEGRLALIKIDEKWIYFGDLSDSTKHLYRMTHNGTGTERLFSNITAETVMLHNSRLYYRLGEYLFTANMDGGNPVKLTQYKISALAKIDDDFVYYQVTSGQMYRTKHDGSETEESDFSLFTVTGFFNMQYSNEDFEYGRDIITSPYNNKNNIVRRSKADGSKTIIATNVLCCVFTDTWLYYASSDYKGYLCKVRLDGSELTKMPIAKALESGDKIKITGDRLYYTAALYDLYFLSLDGKQNVLLN